IDALVDVQDHDSVHHASSSLTMLAVRPCAIHSSYFMISRPSSSPVVSAGHLSRSAKLSSSVKSQNCAGPSEYWVTKTLALNPLLRQYVSARLSMASISPGLPRELNVSMCHMLPSGQTRQKNAAYPLQLPLDLIAREGEE